MAIKRMARPRPATRWLGAALAALVIAAFAVGSAFAFPALGTKVNIDSIGLLDDRSNLTAYTSAGHVYMGPYQIAGSAPTTFTEAMMCFNAGVPAKSGPALATDTGGAIGVFTFGLVDDAAVNMTAKINMISWLASQWLSPTGQSIEAKAAINKAMWEIWADYNPSLSGSGLNLTSGDFWVLGDVTQVNNYITDALVEKGHATAANFLIPG